MFEGYILDEFFFPYFLKIIFLLGNQIIFLSKKSFKFRKKLEIRRNTAVGPTNA